MMTRALLAVLILAIACSGNDAATQRGAPGGVDAGGAPAEPEGGRVSRGGSKAGAVTVSAGEGGMAEAGGLLEVVAGAGAADVEPLTGEGGSGGEPLHAGVGGAGGEPVAPGSGSGAGGSPEHEPIAPWRYCQDGHVCNATELCAYDSATHRVCIDYRTDPVHRCTPTPLPIINRPEGCAPYGLACSVAYSRGCNWISQDAKGTRCPGIGNDIYCGPPT